jgi:dTDP-4-amino-4,6-dideoxygalactose transaminase
MKNNVPYIFKKPINITRPALPDINKYIGSLAQIWDSRHITNSGPKLCEYEKKVSEYLEKPYVKAFVNGHCALEASIRALELTGEVITTPFTFPSTIHALTINRLKPIFCDIDSQTYNIDPDKIEKLITKNTSAILAVHLFGIPCNIQALKKIADKYNLKLIYDAAHAFGVKVNTTSIAKYGDLSVFSTHATKVFHTIEGGLITYTEDNHSEALSQQRNFGYSEKCSNDDIQRIGSNFKMSDLHAAIGLLNLETIDKQIQSRKTIHDLYYSRLSNIPGLDIRAYDNQLKPNYAYQPILINPDITGISRDKLSDVLSQHNVFVRKYFHPLCTHLSCYKETPFYQQVLPIAQNISNNILCLPIYPELEHTSVQNICNIICATLEQKG